MTAPLHLNKTNNSETFLCHITHELLDAIDQNDLKQVEKFLSQILDQNVSEYYIYTLYSYASKKHRENICEYLTHILLTSNNTCNIAKK